MVQTRRLVIEIDPINSRELAARGVRLVLAQPAGNAPPNVTWLALPPVPVTVDWDEHCGLYAGDPGMDDGAPVAMRSFMHPAHDASAYSFSDGGFVRLSGAQHIPHGHYDVLNEAPFAMAFGLLGEAVINGGVVRAPVNSIVLPPGFRASFAAATRVYVWLQRDMVGGKLAPIVPPGTAVVAFERDRSVRRCYYERHTGNLALL